MGALARPGPWRLASWITLAIFVVALLVSGPTPAWGWWALIASGVTFGVELALAARERRRPRGA